MRLLLKLLFVRLRKPPQRIAIKAARSSVEAQRQCFNAKGEMLSLALRVELTQRKCHCSARRSSVDHETPMSLDRQIFRSLGH